MTARATQIANITQKIQILRGVIISVVKKGSYRN